MLQLDYLPHSGGSEAPLSDESWVEEIESRFISDGNVGNVSFFNADDNGRSMMRHFWE
jgi:hypothetical protein